MVATCHHCTSLLCLQRQPSSVCRLAVWTLHAVISIFRCQAYAVQALGAPAVCEQDPPPPRFQFSSSTPDPLDFRSSSPAVRERMTLHPISPMSEDGVPGGRHVVPRCPGLGWGACTVASCAGLMQVVWSVMAAEAYHSSAPLSEASHSSKASNGRVFDPSFLQCCNAQLDQARPLT